MAAGGEREFFGTERLLAFSDGIFAVAITLLVIDLRLPATDSSEAATWDALLAMGPKLLIFVFTFIIIGISWFGHHRKFSYIRRVDGRLLWLNLGYLLMLCLVPFATGVLSERGNRLGFILYSVLMTLLSLLSAAVSAYGLREPYLGSPPPSRAIRQDLTLSPLFTAVVFMVSIGMAFAMGMTIAPYVLLLIWPMSAYFGSRSRTGV